MHSGSVKTQRAESAPPPLYRQIKKPTLIRVKRFYYYHNNLVSITKIFLPFLSFTIMVNRENLRNEKNPTNCGKYVRRLSESFDFLLSCLWHDVVKFVNLLLQLSRDCIEKVGSLLLKLFPLFQKKRMICSRYHTNLENIQVPEDGTNILFMKRQSTI